MYTWLGRELQENTHYFFLSFSLSHPRYMKLLSLLFPGEKKYQQRNGNLCHIPLGKDLKSTQALQLALLQIMWETPG